MPLPPRHVAPVHDDEGLRGWPNAFQDQDWLTFKQPVTEAGARWWHRRFGARTGMLPVDFVEAIVAGAAQFARATFESFDPVDESFTLVVQGLREDPASTEVPVEVFVKRQRFRMRIGTADEGLTKVAPDHQGEGIGTRLMMNVVDLALACGMGRVDMEADDIGRYTWPTMGFLPSTDEVWRGVVARTARRRLTELLHGGYLTAGDHEELMAIVGRPDRLAARTLIVHDATVPGPLPKGGHDRVPVGKVLLLGRGAAWAATLDLENDDEGLELFEAYKERHHAEHPAPRR